MSTEEFKIICDAIVRLIIVVLTIVVIPYIKSKVDAEKLAKIEEYTTLAVRCAEQLFTADEWKQKKEYVLSYISVKAQEIGIDMTSEDIDNLIEGIVNEVKKG